jgi:hypothetical protein
LFKRYDFIDQGFDAREERALGWRHGAHSFYSDFRQVPFTGTGLLFWLDRVRGTTFLIHEETRMVVALLDEMEKEEDSLFIYLLAEHTEQER